MGGAVVLFILTRFPTIALDVTTLPNPVTPEKYKRQDPSSYTGDFLMFVKRFTTNEC